MVPTTCISLRCCAASDAAIAAHCSSIAALSLAYRFAAACCRRSCRLRCLTAHCRQLDNAAATTRLHIRPRQCRMTSLCCVCVDALRSSAMCQHALHKEPLFCRFITAHS